MIHTFRHSIRDILIRLQFTNIGYVLFPMSWACSECINRQPFPFILLPLLMISKRLFESISRCNFTLLEIGVSLVSLIDKASPIKSASTITSAACTERAKKHDL